MALAMSLGWEDVQPDRGTACASTWHGSPRAFGTLHEPPLVHAAQQQAARNASSIPYAASEGEGWGGVITCNGLPTATPSQLKGIGKGIGKGIETPTFRLGSRGAPYAPTISETVTQ